MLHLHYATLNFSLSCRKSMMTAGNFKTEENESISNPLTGRSSNKQENQDNSTNDTAAEETDEPQQSIQPCIQEYFPLD